MAKAKTTKKASKKQEYSNVIFLLDETGSMQTSKSDTIGGFNTFINEQKKLKNKIKFSLTLFNSNKVEKKYRRVDIKDVIELTNDTYLPTGATPLNDAIGKTITDNADLKQALVVILTDGEENDSREYSLDAVKKLIEEKQKNGWAFLYLGVDIANFEHEAQSRGMHFSVNTMRGDMTGSYAKMSNMVNTYANVSPQAKSAFDTKEEYDKS